MTAYALMRLKNNNLEETSMTNATTSTSTPHSTEKDVYIATGTILEDEQITTADTGWSEEEKDRMRQAGYDDVDMIRAWYS